MNSTMNSIWHDVNAPTPRDWLDMAQSCHATGEDWSMWLALILWAAAGQDCSALGVCQGHKPPCADCPNRR